MLKSGLDNPELVSLRKPQFLASWQLFTIYMGKPVGSVQYRDTLAPFFVFNAFWRHLWSITEQTHGNMESIC